MKLLKAHFVKMLSRVIFIKKQGFLNWEKYNCNRLKKGGFYEFKLYL